MIHDVLSEEISKVFLLVVVGIVGPSYGKDRYRNEENHVLQQIFCSSNNHNLNNDFPLEIYNRFLK